MTEAQPLEAPAFVPDIQDTVLFMAEHMAVTRQGDLTIDLYMAGLNVEAEVRRTHPTEPSTLVLRERITLEPTMQAWLKDLLDRAQKETP